MTTSNNSSRLESLFLLSNIYHFINIIKSWKKKSSTNMKLHT